MYQGQPTLNNSMIADTHQLSEQALEAHKIGDFRLAEEKYLAILKVQPSHAEANHNLGLIAVSNNRPLEAIRLFKTALYANPESEQLWVSYLRSLLDGKHLKKAKEVLKQAKKKGIQSIELDALQANLVTSKALPSQTQKNELLTLYQNGRFADAEDLAVTFTKQFPKDQLAWKVLGAIFGSTGKKNEALAANLKAVDLSPEDAQAHSNLGITFKQLGRLDEAVSSYTRAIKLTPAFAEAYSNLGITLQELERLDEAVSSYKQAIKLKPNYAEAHNNLGNTLSELDKLDEAIASYKQAIKLKPDYAEAHNNLGNALSELGKLDEAEACYKRAIALQPDHAEAHSNLGLTLQELGELDEAIASYEKAIALQPDDASAHCNLGMALREIGRLDEAEASYARALALEPDNAKVHNNLGNMLRKLGRLDEAEASYARALLLEPDYAEVLLNKGYLSFDKGEYETALKYADACNSKSVNALPLMSLYALGRVSEVYERLEVQYKTDEKNINVAAFASFIAEVNKKPNAYNFCPNPMDFVHVSRLSSHVSEAIDFTGGIVEELHKVKTKRDPLGKTTVRGFQSLPGLNILKSPTGKIAHLKTIIINEIEAYYSKFQNEQCAYIQKFPTARNLFGWTVTLKQEGHQNPHIHPSGWLSGVIYLKVVPSLGKNEGAIEFSLNSKHYNDANLPCVTLQPEVGDMVFFPSSLHHRTIPFTTDAERIIVSFDLLPEMASVGTDVK